jgi:hypothetical protein
MSVSPDLDRVRAYVWVVVTALKIAREIDSTAADIFSPSRVASVVWERDALIRALIMRGFTRAQVAELLRRDHSTISTAIKRRARTDAGRFARLVALFDKAIALHEGLKGLTDD